jgi:hypothetical protein
MLSSNVLNVTSEGDKISGTKHKEKNEEYNERHVP